MLRFLQFIFLVGSSIAKSFCNEDYYDNCIEKQCSTWFDGNHTCDIVYDKWKMVNMTCKDVICDKPHGPICVEPGYHLNTTCELVPNFYGWSIFPLTFIYIIPLLGFVITSIYCAPRQRFSTKLTDIDKDIGTTCLTCWCPCITFGELFQLTYKVPSIFGCLLYFFCGTSKCCLGMVNRAKLRQKYNIVEDPGSDCMIDACIHCWAHPCALCQEKRELDYRNVMESTTRTNNTLLEPHRPVFVVMASSVGDQPIVINGTLPEVNNDDVENGPIIQILDHKK